MQAVLARPLEHEGWTIRSQADTASRGVAIDLIVERNAQRLAIIVPPLRLRFDLGVPGSNPPAVVVRSYTRRGGGGDPPPPTADRTGRGTKAAGEDRARGRAEVSRGGCAHLRVARPPQHQHLARKTGVRVGLRNEVRPFRVVSNQHEPDDDGIGGAIISLSRGGNCSRPMCAECSEGSRVLLSVFVDHARDELSGDSPELGDVCDAETVAERHLEARDAHRVACSFK